MEKSNFMDRFMQTINEKIAPVVGAFGENKFIQSIVRGMVGVVPVTFLGAIFLLLLILGTYIPALAAITPAIMTGYNLTLGMLGFYVALSVGISYAKLYDLNQLTAAIVSVTAFLTIIVQVDLATGSISLANFGSTGIFPALLTTLIAMSIYRFFIVKDLVIKMPAGVPPMIGEMFSAMIPAIIITLLTWFVRSVLNFDLATFLAGLLAPIFQGADNIWVMTGRMVLGMVFWGVGLHGEAMLMGAIQPFQTVWQTANAAAAVAGDPLPYIWTGSFERVVLWVPAVWGLMFWMFTSKVKSLRSLAIAATPAAIFAIVEPIIFGLPIAFNAYLLIPFVLSTTITSFLTYLLTQVGFFAKFYVGLPWFTPPPILAVGDSGGAWVNLLIIVMGLAIGILIYWPFFKAYEKKELEKEALAEAEAEAAAS